jgi:uncharacterized Zn finger protein (UPF0148 family)
MSKEPLANLQSNSEEPFATHNEVCEETAPAEKAEQMQERLSQLTIQVPEPLMRFDEADAEDHERAEVEQWRETSWSLQQTQEKKEITIPIQSHH